MKNKEVFVLFYDTRRGPEISVYGSSELADKAVINIIKDEILPLYPENSSEREKVKELLEKVPDPYLSVEEALNDQELIPQGAIEVLQLPIIE